MSGTSSGAPVIVTPGPPHPVMVRPRGGSLQSPSWWQGVVNFTLSRFVVAVDVVGGDGGCVCVCVCEEGTRKGTVGKEEKGRKRRILMREARKEREEGSEEDIPDKRRGWGIGGGSAVNLG